MEPVLPLSVEGNVEHVCFLNIRYSSDKSLKICSIKIGLTAVLQAQKRSTKMQIFQLKEASKGSVLLTTQRESNKTLL